MEHKLLPIQLIWLHLVYGKMFSLTRHLVLMVSKENILHNIIGFFCCLYILLPYCQFFIGGRCYCQFLVLCLML